jgi:hypothetical protein
MLKSKIATIVTLVVLAGTSSLCSGQCRYGPASPTLPIGLTLVIRTIKPVAETSRSVIVQIELSNQSNTPIRMRDNLFAERDYELHVRDDKGKEVAFTKWGRQIRTGPIRGSGNDVTLAPGEKYEDQEDLSHIYDISLPGNYTVEACRELYVWGNIYSNRIVIPFVLPARGGGSNGSP